METDFLQHIEELLFCAPWCAGQPCKVAISDDLYDRYVVLDNVLYVPGLHSNLISCSQLCDSGYVLRFGRTTGNGMIDGIMQFQGRLFEGVYRIIGNSVYHGINYSVFVTVSRVNKEDEDDGLDKSSVRLWHARLGHANMVSIKKLFSSCAVTGLRPKPKSIKSPCEGCQRGKQTRQTLRSNNSRAEQRCAVVHTDVCLSRASHVLFCCKQQWERRRC